MRVFSAYAAGVGIHDRHGESTSGEDFLVRLHHRDVAQVQGLLVGVEAIGVFHHELARSEQPGSGAGLVPELGLDLIQVYWKVAVAADVCFDHRRDGLFVGWREYQLSVAAIFECGKWREERVGAAGLLPDLSWLDHRHVYFERACGIHLLPDDLCDLALAAPAEWQELVEARRELLDESRPDQQLVADGLGLCWSFSERLSEGAGDAHSGGSVLFEMIAI